MNKKEMLDILRKAIVYKRKRNLKKAILSNVSEDFISEAKKKKLPAKKKGELVKKEKNLPVEDKRKRLKMIYEKILKGTPYENNIPVFLQLIDTVPEDYLDYELGINLGDALKMVDELIRGEGDLTDNELANLANIIPGVGVPALEKHASGKEKLSKKSAKFGAKAINKNTKEFLDSLEARRNPKYQLEAPLTKQKEGLVKVTKNVVRPDKVVKPEEREVPKTGRRRPDSLQNILGKIGLSLDIDKDSQLFKIASRLQTKGINIERIARSVKNSKTYSEAKKKVDKELNKMKQENPTLDYKESDIINTTYELWKEQKAKQKAEAKRKK